VLAEPLDDALHLLSRRGRGLKRKQSVEPLFEIGLIDFERGVGEAVSAASESAGAFEQPLHAGREDVVAGVLGVLDVADQMRQTDLMTAVGPA
jgi:hypothetical protein